MNRVTKGLLALALAGLLQLGWAQISSAEVVDRIVAEVNDEIITMSELQGASKSIEAQSGIKPTGKESKEIERSMLESLIDRKLAKAEAKRRGIKDVAFAKRKGLSVLEMVKSNWVYKQLKNFRAGIEASISWLKRSFGLSCCDWAGWFGFKKYIWSSLVSYNLLVLGRLKLDLA